MAISQEQVPDEVDEILKEFLTRRFIDIGIEFTQPSKFPERKEMPYKPRIGDIHYFGDIAEHNYDPIITAEGWWGFKNTGWVQIG